MVVMPPAALMGIPAMMVPVTVVPMMVMMVADMDADIADMQADADGIGRSRRRTEQAEGEYGSNQFFHPCSSRSLRNWAPAPQKQRLKRRIVRYRDTCAGGKRKGRAVRPGLPFHACAPVQYQRQMR